MRKSHSCEADVKQDVKELFRKYNVWYFMPSMNGYGRSGVPDFIACVRGHFLAVETKFGGNKPTHNQEREIMGINDACGTALVINESDIGFLDFWLSARLPKGD